MPNLPDQETDTKLMPGEAAARLGVTTKTLTVMSALHPIILPSGHRRYLAAEVNALLIPSTTVGVSTPDPTPTAHPAPVSTSPDVVEPGVSFHDGSAA